MNPGTKLKRIGPSYRSTRIKNGSVYTYAGSKDGFIRLKEFKREGFVWDLKLFEVIP